MITTASDVIQTGAYLDVPDFPPTANDQLCDPRCEICGGIGYVRWHVPQGHPHFGKLDPCPNMSPRRKSRDYLKRYGLSETEIAMDWNSIIPIADSNISEVAGKVKKVFDRGYGWIYLWGSFGLGKTLLLQITAAEAIRKEKEAMYIRMAEIMDMLREGYSRDNYDERMQYLQTVPVLCIDEFDRISEKKAVDGISWVSEKRFTLMDVRYVSAGRGESLTIMTGNKNPAELVFDDGYLLDRIQDNRFLVLEVTGESLRPGMEWKK